jgi:dTDP-4-dehydrorhamnose reductase
VARVLVTGGNGMLGSTLVPTLRERGHGVSVLARGPQGDVAADLVDPASVCAALDAAAPDVIVNLAAATNVDACEKDPAMAFAANALSVRNLADWMEARGGGTHLVQVSTDQLYAGDGPHAEADERPINYYAWSKLAGELYAGRAGATVLRTNLFGRSRCPGRASLSDWLVERLRTSTRTSVFADVLFSPLSLETLSEMIALAVERRVQGTFNLGSHGGTSKADFAFRLAEQLGFPTDVLVRSQSSEVALVARRPGDMRMNVAKFETGFAVKLPTLDSEISSMRKHYGSPH